MEERTSGNDEQEKTKICYLLKQTNQRIHVPNGEFLLLLHVSIELQYQLIGHNVLGGYRFEQTATKAYDRTKLKHESTQEYVTH
ncbi:hypothetical protein RchiOBHm_Chr1g0343871 [Rosa chinensis]|uniref:Uncharacterized protein n=1 Tax=Rosa chinensis TaxID=74649 RepID=A0A2P6SED2_ROSCH|nr:hypothetical protein RchiOBHm_Chr1g0343871 [Rosa chinensis]